MAGKSPYLNAVHLRGPMELTGSVVATRILAAQTNSLAGEIVG